MAAPVVLVILDGWGLGPPGETNAVSLARTPHFDGLWEKYPHTQLSASGVDAGLPAGIMGNSEVGHLNLGAGRVVQQEVSRINQAIDDGHFFDNEVFVDLIGRIKKTDGALHLLGLMSDGLVHSAEKHYLALLDLARRHGVPGDRLFIHAILDGRDTPPQSAPDYLHALRQKMQALDAGRLATVIGRYYAMDRDNRWDRIQKAYDAFTAGKGEQAASAEEAIQKAYDRGETDEFVLPTVIMEQDAPVGPIKDGDGVIMFNYRADRGREIIRALTTPEFDGFDRGERLDIAVATMTEYDAELNVPFAYRPPGIMKNILGETISAAGRKQLRAAETEKYPHVTYFFNGGRETPFEGEDRIMAPSPKWVATYDEQPEMSAPGLAWKAVHALQSGSYDFILINFANPDMVGHTGSIPAATTAVEAADWSLGAVMDAVRQAGGKAVVTADHGNAEMMVDPETGKPHTAHTTNPVPLILVDDACTGKPLREGGRLADVAPTVLALMGITKPEDMSGSALTDTDAAP